MKISIKQGAPFENFFPGLQSMFKDSFTKQSTVLEKGLRKAFDDILQDFDLNFVVVQVPDKKRDCLQEQLKHFVNYAKAQADGPIATELARAKECTD